MRCRSASRLELTLREGFAPGSLGESNLFTSASIILKCLRYGILFRQFYDLELAGGVAAAAAAGGGGSGRGGEAGLS